MLITSILAPLRGTTNPILTGHFGDYTSGHAFWHHNFNPRSPCGGRPERYKPNGITKLLQSTHPMRGATVIDKDTQKEYKTSIHAPHAGCDIAYYRTPLLFKDFNSRTPCGARLFLYFSLIYVMSFQFTHPHAGCDLIVIQKFPYS